MMNVSGYSLFMSNFHRGFSSMSEEDQFRMIFGNITFDNVVNGSDYDSTDSLSVPQVDVRRYGLRENNMCILHIASLQRMKHIFTISGLCPSEFSIDGI